MERLNKETYHQSMRGYFAGELYNHMIKNNNIYVITADLGYGVFDKIKDAFPNRFVNTGAAEQAALGMAVGLSKEGKIPFVYSITPFLVYRPYEIIRNYINKAQYPVKLIGSGRDKDYSHDGFSHDATDVKYVFKYSWKNIETYWPEDKDEIPKILNQTISNSKPTFISLKR